ncbi:MAG: hypothetical protein ACLSAP_05340 [Oscillospiraceae bacterium]
MLTALALCLQLLPGSACALRRRKPRRCKPILLPQWAGGRQPAVRRAEDVRVTGTLSNGRFTFGEDATVSMTATFDEGWTYNRDFSISSAPMRRALQ